MFRLLYISRATTGTTREQVQDIERSSHVHNPAAGITGVLVHGGGHYMQVLEGPERAVLRMYVKILEDRRHEDCGILHISPAKERIFQRWSMGVIERAPLEFAEIAELQARRLEAVEPTTFIAAMRGFVRMLNTGT